MKSVKRVIAAATLMASAAWAGPQASQDAAVERGTVIDVDSHAYVLERVDPVYPYEMQLKGVSGRAVVKVIVSETGRIAEAKILSASLPDFGKSALRAIEKWSFAPSLKDGRGVPAVAIIPVSYRVGDSLDDQLPMIAYR